MAHRLRPLRLAMGAPKSVWWTKSLCRVVFVRRHRARAFPRLVAVGGVNGFVLVLRHCSLAQAMLRHPPPHSNRVAFLAFRRWAQFTTRAASLDVDLICDLLEEKLEDDNWRARLKVSEKGGGQWERVCCVVKLCGAPMWDDGCGGRETASPSSVALNRFSAEILAACIPLTPPLVWA